jgi:hypothetical protein
MPYGLGTVWNVTSKYIYTDPVLDKNVGIGTISPVCDLDVYGNIAENGILLENKYNLKPENNKKYDLIIREKLNDSTNALIIGYQFNKESFNCNLSTLSYGTLKTIGTRKAIQKEYYVGTGSAEINADLYYNIEMDSSKFNAYTYAICFWLFLNEECGTNKYILYTEYLNPNSHRFSLKYTTDKNLEFIPTAGSSILSSTKINKNKWYHITIIIDDATTNSKYLQININGVNDIKTTDQNINFITPAKENKANIYLGHSNINDRINGYIDDFRIYKTALDTQVINSNIIGNITTIIPGNISANGNYGIDIVNYCNIVNVGSQYDNVNLAVYGNLKVISNLEVNSLSLMSTLISDLYSSNLTVYSNATINNLTVTNDIIENQRKLSEKYALIGSIDKNTDVIISKMIDTDDVRKLYNEMLEYFKSNLIIAYNFDFNINSLNESSYFFSNVSRDLNGNTNAIYTEFANYNVNPIIPKQSSIDYYGYKYVKGNSSLICGPLDYYYFNVNSTNNNATFHDGHNYTITFWIRFTKIDQKQHILKFGDIDNYINLYLNNSNILEFENRNTSSISYNTNILQTESINTTIFNKDEWYHISILLKNNIGIDNIPKITKPEDNNLLINSFINIDYINNTNVANTNYTFANKNPNQATVFIYINGIQVCKQIYAATIPIFDSTRSLNYNYFGGFDNSNILNGYIDDFKMYNCIIPISYINKYIIGNALVIKPGQLSAIGNYGINIKNFTNEVTIGALANNVDLSIYGLLKSYNNKITISNVDINVNNNNLITSNLNISDILTTNCNIANNVQIINTIKGHGFTLGSNNNNIDTISITTITNNSNLISSNIIVDTMTVTNRLVLDNSTLLKLNVTNINIDNIINSSNNYITIYSNLIIGDNSFNNKRYDFGKFVGNILGNVLPGSDFTDANMKPFLDLIKISSNNNITIYDKPFIFHGIDNIPDIHMKNAYIRENTCNIRTEIDKSRGADRNKTRIQTDVGNIKVQNGYIEIYDLNISTNTISSKLILNEDNINIQNNLFNLKLNSNGYYYSNNNYTNIFTNNQLKIQDTAKYSILTSSNFIFDNNKGFINTNTLDISNIIVNVLSVDRINTTNSNSSVLSINTSNINNPFGKIQGFLCDASKIDILYEINTNSNVKANKGIFDTINTSNIICSSNLSIGSTIITSNNVSVTNLVVTGSITLGAGESSGNNSINGGLGTLQIASVKTTNPNSNIFSIDTLISSNLGKIRGLLSSNSIIDIDCNITTKATIYSQDLITSNTLSALNIKGIGSSPCLIIGNLTGNSIIDINSNITTSATIYAQNLTTSNILNALNITGIGSSPCLITGNLINNSLININCNITTSANIYSQYLTTSNTLSASNITGIGSSPCLITGNLIGNSLININSNITTSANIYSQDLTTSNTLSALNIKGIGSSPCLITGNLIGNSLININSNITTSANIYSQDLTTSNTLSALNIKGIGSSPCLITGNLINNSLININCNITTSANIYAQDLITSNTLSASNIKGIGSSPCLITGNLTGNSIIDINSNITTRATIYAQNLTTSNILNASNITGIGSSLCLITGNLTGNSIIDINSNITTRATIYAQNLTTSNILNALNITGIGSSLCLITGHLTGNSLININCNITTNANITAANFSGSGSNLTTLNAINITAGTLPVARGGSGLSNLESGQLLVGNSGSLLQSSNLFWDSTNNRLGIGKNNPISTLDVNGSITGTLFSGSGTNLTALNATNINSGTLVVSNGGTGLTNLASGQLLVGNSDSLLQSANLTWLNTTNTLSATNIVVSSSASLRSLSISSIPSIPSIQSISSISLSNNYIQCYDYSRIRPNEIDINKYIKIEGSTLKTNVSSASTELNIIYYDAANKLVINCDKLITTEFDVGDGSLFSFPNIIKFGKNTAIGIQIPNIYIGYTDIALSTFDSTKDVLYVNTPNNSRLRTGNLLVENVLEIGRVNDAYSMLIYTGRFNTPSKTDATIILSSPFTNFANFSGDTIISLSHDNQSVGINVQPPNDLESVIKLYVDGGIQTTDDIIAFKNISDRRFKTNIVSFTDKDIDIVNKLNPVRFKWINGLFNSNMANKNDIGFIAQEVKEFIPEAVSTCKIELNDIDYNYINYERIIPYLVNNIKYLNNKIVELENKLNGI